jgi:hypothetical protein
MSPDPAKPTGLAAFGTTDMGKVAPKKDSKKPQSNKYKEFLDAIHSTAFSDKNIDEQTGLQWDNIEGETMGVVLTEELFAGSMFTEINHPFFRFATLDEFRDQYFLKIFKETLERHPYLTPAITASKQKLNELMVSLERQGRQELVEMVRSFQVSMQDNEKSDPMMKAMMR